MRKVAIGAVVLGLVLVTLPGTTTRSGADHTNLIVRPDLVLDGDTTITVDPRPAKPISVTPPAPTTLALGDIGYELPGLGENYLTTTDLSTVSTANAGPPLPDDGLIARVNTQWDGQDGSFYGLAWFPTGALPTGFTKVVDKRDLATINADYGSTGPKPSSARTNCGTSRRSDSAQRIRAGRWELSLPPIRGGSARRESGRVRPGRAAR